MDDPNAYDYLPPGATKLFEPAQWPSSIRSLTYGKIQRWSREYKITGDKLGVGYDQVALGGPTLERVNQARQAALVEGLAPNDRASYAPLPATLLPTYDTMGEPVAIDIPEWHWYYFDAGPDAAFYHQASSVALILTAGWMKYALCGILLALASDKCRTFAAHGGRPRGSKKP